MVWGFWEASGTYPAKPDPIPPPSPGGTKKPWNILISFLSILASKQVDIAVLTPPPSSESEQESDQEYLNEKEIIRVSPFMSEDSSVLI